jgi:hypothetical protein
MESKSSSPADQATVDNTTATPECESTSKRQKQDPSAADDKVCVLVSETEYKAGYLDELPSIKYWVPAELVEGLVTSLIRLTVCFSSDEVDEDDDKEIEDNRIYYMNMLSAAERKLVKTLHIRSAVLSPEGHVFYARHNGSGVTLRDEHNTERSAALGPGGDYDTFHNKCNQIATEEAKKEQETNTKDFAEKCTKADKHIFSHMFLPPRITLADKNAIPSVYVVATEIWDGQSNCD